MSRRLSTARAASTGTASLPIKMASPVNISSMRYWREVNTCASGAG